MAPAGLYGTAQAPGPRETGTARLDEGRLDPKLERLPSGAAQATLPSYLIVGLPICFTIALGIILMGFEGAVTIEAVVLLALGSLGLLLVRYLNRQS